ncbi:autotransporter outer membrane beta-barrel domain-containing protein [Orbus wheelerorum]|uniref:autotransporter outer membrane beta-barrel domain-containing protein n=1 Tax=Orbus wheelerorum TaxID=3074111 RepID=UPI00370DB8FA
MEIKYKHKVSLTIIALSLCNFYSSESFAITCNNGGACPDYPSGTNQSVVQQSNGSLFISGDNQSIFGGGLNNLATAQANNQNSFIGLGWSGLFPSIAGTLIDNRLEIYDLTLNVSGSQGADRGVQTFLKDGNQDQALITSINDYQNFNTISSGSLSTSINDSNISLVTTGQTVSQNTIGINSEAYGSGQDHSLETRASNIFVDGATQSAIGVVAKSNVVDSLIHGSTTTATANEISTFGAKSIDIDINQTSIEVKSATASATGIYTDYVQNGGKAEINTDINSLINVITDSVNSGDEANGVLAKTNSLGSNATTSIDLSSDITVASTNSAGVNAYGIQSHSFINDIENRGKLIISSAGADATGIYASATFYNQSDDRINGGFNNRYGSTQKVINTGDIEVTANTKATGIEVEGYNGIISIENSNRINISGDNSSIAINVSTGKTLNTSYPFTQQPNLITIRNSGYLITNSANNYNGSGIVINAETGVLNGSTVTNTGMINAQDVIEASSTVASDVRLRNSGWLYGNINFSQNGNHIINQTNGIISGVYDSASVVGTSNNVGQIILGTGNAQYIMTGGILNSDLHMGDGTNIGHISGASKLNYNIQLEGGATRSGDSSKLTLKGQTLNVFTDTVNNIKGVNLVNWDNTLLESSIITLDGDLFSSTRTGNLNIDGDSILYSTNPGTSTINGNVTNSGLINLVSTKNPNDVSKVSTLLIKGNYNGDSNKRNLNGSSIVVNTVWNNDLSTSYSDSVHITGTATGYTQVKTLNGIIGDVTSDKVTWKDKYSNDVIVVDNHAVNSNNFYGFANTTGAGLLLLVQKDANTYAWRLASPSNPDSGHIVPIDPKAPGTALMPLANLNAEYAIISTLHQRVSEQQTMAWDDCSTCQIEHNEGQVWGRLIGNYGDVKQIEKRLEYKSKLWGAQFGYDFSVNYDKNDNSRSHSGVMVTYAKDNLKFYDAQNVIFDTNSQDYISQRAQTGHGQSDIFGLGAYYTYYSENGSYLDLLGNLTYIRNKYTTDDSSDNKNHAYGVAGSIEVGRPYALTNHGLNNGDWLLEPQAQMIYQYLKYNDIDIDRDHNFDVIVDQHNQQTLRARVGLRLAYNTGTEELKTRSIYLIANIIHDFMGGKGVSFGTSSIDYPDNATSGEAGIGAQIPLGNSSYLYFDTRYHHSFGDSKGKYKQYNGTIGYKYHW